MWLTLWMFMIEAAGIEHAFRFLNQKVVEVWMKGEFLRSQVRFTIPTSFTRTSHNKLFHSTSFSIFLRVAHWDIPKGS